MTDDSWREGPPRALQLMVFRQTCDGLEPVKVPKGVTLETVGEWLRQDGDTWAGWDYTVLSVATEDVFEVDLVHNEVVVSNVKSTIY